jgi:polysaccharide biosynthesis protein PslH
VRESMPGYHGRLEVIPNGVDLETRRFGMNEPQRDTLVFNGSLTYAANLEAIRWFIVEVWPLIQQKRPGTRLAITGNTDGLDLSWLAGDPSITLTGYLEDVRPVVAQSWLAVAPLRSGGGTRLKILEAMALGTPVTATSKGAEGLDVTPDKNILIADNPDDFALQCLRVLDSTSLRSTLAGEARHLVEQNYDWAMIGEKFCELVELTTNS